MRSFIVFILIVCFQEVSWATPKCSQVFSKTGSEISRNTYEYFKSLIQSGQLDKAEESFHDLKASYPNDPLVIEIEIELLGTSFDRALEGSEAYLSSLDNTQPTKIEKKPYGVKVKQARNPLVRKSETEPLEDSSERVEGASLDSPGEAKSTVPELHRLTREGTRLKKSGKLREARDAYEEALVLDPNNPIALSQAGYMNLMLGEYPRAKKLLDHAQHVEPHNREVFWNRLQVRLAMGNVAEVEKFIEPIGGSNLKVFAVAALEILKENFDEAIVVLNESPLTPAFLRLRAQAYFQKLNYQAAHKDLIKIVQMTQAPDYFAIAALMRIEIGDLPLENYELSPTMLAISSGMDMAQLKALVQVDVSEFWRFKPQTSFAHKYSNIQNSFWDEGGGMYQKPVDSKAVREVRVPRK